VSGRLAGRREPPVDESEITVIALTSNPTKNCMISKALISPVNREKDATTVPGAFMRVTRIAARVLIVSALILFAYSLAWNFSTRRYLKGFADAIVPLGASPQEKTEALTEWFHHEPQRIAYVATESTGLLHDRDPVTIVQNARLLKICGSASNAFMNLADVAGLKVRRLLLLDQSGGAVHVVAEVQWGDRWVVVNPQQGLVFKDHLGRGLTKEELRDPEVFRDAISRMPGYSSTYTFERTHHIRLERIPILGELLRGLLDHVAPGWEESINWGYFPENPSLWLMLVSLPLLLLGILGNRILNRHVTGQASSRLRLIRD
jgi:hypothetical protein